MIWVLGPTRTLGDEFITGAVILQALLHLGDGNAAAPTGHADAHLSKALVQSPKLYLPGLLLHARQGAILLSGAFSHLLSYASC